MCRSYNSFMVSSPGVHSPPARDGLCVGDEPDVMDQPGCFFNTVAAGSHKGLGEVHHREVTSTSYRAVEEIEVVTFSLY
jgi:hypothetical protein